jgi:hypothetical protein
MGRALTPDELDQLLGAYALDALADDDERVAVEAWLARSPNARRDADELRETASLLAQSAEEPPGDLWSRIESRLGETDTDLPVPPLRMPDVVELGARHAASPDVTPAVPVGSAAPSRRRPWFVGIAAALALVVAVGVGVVAGGRLDDQDQRIDRLAVGMEARSMERAALAASMQPGARTAQLAAAGDATMTAEVVVTPDGHGYFMTDAMPRLPAGRTYQLWALMGDETGSPAVSVGGMGREPTVMAFTADAGVTGFVVTEEDAPGVARSDRLPMLQGRLA